MSCIIMAMGQRQEEHHNLLMLIGAWLSLEPEIIIKVLI